MKMTALVLVVAAAPVLALAGDSGSDMNTFVLKDGATTRVGGSTDELDHFETKMREMLQPALFTRIEGRDYVISDPTFVDRARAIFARSVPIKAEKRALKHERLDLMRRQRQLQPHGGNDADAAKLDAEERSLEERWEKHDAERERVSREMKVELNDLAQEAIRAGKAL